MFKPGMYQLDFDAITLDRLTYFVHRLHTDKDECLLRMIRAEYSLYCLIERIDCHTIFEPLEYQPTDKPQAKYYIDAEMYLQMNALATIYKEYRTIRNLEYTGNAFNDVPLWVINKFYEHWRHYECHGR